jgi:hypothetical protein
MNAKVFRVTRNAGIQVLPADNPAVSAEKGSATGREPSLYSVVSLLSEGFGAVLVGKAVTNPGIKRIEVQLKPRERKLGKSGSTSEAIKLMINAFFPNFKGVREHSGIVVCRDSKGNLREVLVQESNYQERLDSELIGNKTKSRQYSDSLKASLVGRVDEAPIFVCQLDDPNSMVGFGDIQPQRQAVLASFLGSSLPPKKVEEPVSDSMNITGSSMSVNQIEAARKQMEKARELKETRERRRQRSNEPNWRQP